MKIEENVSLREHSSMRLGGTARFLTTVNSEEDLLSTLDFAKEKGVKFTVVGEGSNIVWTDDGYSGLVIVMKIEHLDAREEDGSFIFKVGAGNNWDDFVEETVKKGLSGIEALSLIPGSCGAAPVQNIGAYGQEASDTIELIRALDTSTNEFIEIPNSDCGFGYRKSIFNSEQKGRYIITNVQFRLHKLNPQPPFYKDVDSYFESMDIISPSPSQLREAVIAIRSDKLPDPSRIPNNGSFFKNPIVSHQIAEKLKTNFPDIPAWELNENEVKLSAGWLVENSGFNKGYEDSQTGMAIWKNQALVLVNKTAKSSADLFTFRDKIVDSVKSKFGLVLLQEPDIVI